MIAVDIFKKSLGVKAAFSFCSHKNYVVEETLAYFPIIKRYVVFKQI